MAKCVHDGDTGSADSVYMAESIEEVKAYLRSKQSMVSPSGSLYAKPNTDTIELVLRFLLSDVADEDKV